MKIRSTRQFKERVDAAFETQKTRDEAKACYGFQREEFEALPKRYIRVKFELNKAKIKADALDAEALAKAVARVMWPFLTGALAGFLAGCTVGGIGPNFFGA